MVNINTIKVVAKLEQGLSVSEILNSYANLSLLDFNNIMFNARFLEPLSKLITIISAAGNGATSMLGGFLQELLKLSALILSVQSRARKSFKNITPIAAYNELNR